MDYVSPILLESRRVILNRTDLLEWMLIAKGLGAGCNFKNSKISEIRSEKDISGEKSAEPQWTVS